MYGIREEVMLVFYINGQKLLDEERAKLLLLINKYGSILSASKQLNIPYTRAWEYIMKIENIFGRKIIEARRGGRGGGGAKLTEDGLKLLNMYQRSYLKHLKKELSILEDKRYIERGAIIYIGSDDILLKQIIRLIRIEGYRIEPYYIGSLKGLAALILGESDFTGIHLYDPESDTYNKPYIERYSKGMELTLLNGYKRLQGFVSREEYTLDEILDKLFKGELRFINRNPGSGTRILIETLFKKYMDENGLKEYPEKYIKGYDEYVNTHLEVASKVMEGYADVGLCLKWCANYYGLSFTPVKWEKFDFIVRSEDLNKAPIKALINILRGSEFQRILRESDGYDIGS